MPKLSRSKRYRRVQENLFMIPEELCGSRQKRPQQHEQQRRTISSLLGEACLSLCGGGDGTGTGTSALRRVSDDDIQLRSSQSSSTEGSSSSSSSTGCYPIEKSASSGSSRSNLKRPAPSSCLVQFSYHSTANTGDDSSAALLCQTPGNNSNKASTSKTRSISMGSYHDLSSRETPTVTPCAGDYISPENHQQQPQHQRGNWISPSNNNNNNSNSNSLWGYFVDHEASNCSRFNNDCDIQGQKSFVPSCPNSPADGCDYFQLQRRSAPSAPRPLGWDASTALTRTPPPPTAPVIGAGSNNNIIGDIIKPRVSTKRQRIRSLSWSPEAPVENASAAKPIPVSLWPTAGEDSSDDFVLRAPGSIEASTTARSGENCSHHHHHHHRMIMLAQKAFQSLRVDDDNNGGINNGPFHWNPQMEMKEKRSLPF